MTGAHVVDWSDERRRWECSCGWHGSTLAAASRHALATGGTGPVPEQRRPGGAS